MSKPEMIKTYLVVEKLKTKLLGDEKEYHKDNPNDYTSDEWERRTIQIKTCKTVTGVAKWCQDDAWDIESFISFLVREIFDEDSARWINELHPNNWDT